MKRVVNIYSEVKPLKKVLLYRPSNELVNILPDNMAKHNYSDIPDIGLIQSEHDSLANLLRLESVDVIYLIDLIVDCFNINPNVKEKFIKQYIKEAKVKIGFVYNEIYKLLSSISDNRKFVNKCLEGIRYSEINVPNSSFFNINNVNGLVIEPLSGLCYLRDYIMGIGDGFILSSSKDEIKHRSSIFLEYIFKYHPKYKNSKVYNGRNSTDLINTGDILVLNDEVLLISITKNTPSLSVCNLASKILKDKKFKYVITLDIKDTLKSYSIDSLITMINDDTFIVHNELLDLINVYELGMHNDKIVVNLLHMSLDKVLAKYLHLKQVNLIKCANGNYFDYSKEQYHQAVNVFCVDSNKVISFDINHVTNEQLEEGDIKVMKFNGSQFLKGNRGVHSIVVPLIREK